MWKHLLGFLDCFHTTRKVLNQPGPIIRVSDSEIRSIAHDSHPMNSTCPEQKSTREIWTGFHNLREKYTDLAVVESSQMVESAIEATSVPHNIFSTASKHARTDDFESETESDDGIIELTKRQFETTINRPPKRSRIILNATSGFSDLGQDDRHSAHAQKGDNDPSKDAEDTVMDNEVGFATSGMFMTFFGFLSGVYPMPMKLWTMVDLSGKERQQKCFKQVKQVARRDGEEWRSGHRKIQQN